MRVWEKIDTFQEERGSWNGWLTSLTRHAALNHARRISRHGGAEAPSERLLFYRKYYYLPSTAQIALEPRLTERAVEGRLYRLKRQLRKLPGGDERS